jgi:hypothetical protein
VDRIHQGLRTETLGMATGGEVTFTEIAVTHGKDDVVRGLHAVKRSFNLSGGVKAEDVLGWLRFNRRACHLIGEQHAFCAPAADGVDVAAFASAFETAVTETAAADKQLQECGFFLEARDFPAKHWTDLSSDGHTGESHEKLKETDDARFRYILTWMKHGDDGGWTTHYVPKEPLSPDEERVFARLGIRRYEQCIELDFSPCYCRRLRRIANDRDRFFSDNNETVHKWFDEHVRRFAAGVDHLLKGHAAVSDLGLGLLPAAERSGAINRSGRLRPGSRR